MKVTLAGSTQSEDFRVRWAQHNVREHISGIKQFPHRVVGDINLAYDGLDLVADPGLTVFTYTAEPLSAVPVGPVSGDGART